MLLQKVESCVVTESGAGSVYEGKFLNLTPKETPYVGLAHALTLHI